MSKHDETEKEELSSFGEQEQKPTFDYEALDDDLRAFVTLQMSPLLFKERNSVIHVLDEKNVKVSGKGKTSLHDALGSQKPRINQVYNSLSDAERKAIDLHVPFAAFHVFSNYLGQQHYFWVLKKNAEERKEFDDLFGELVENFKQISNCIVISKSMNRIRNRIVYEPNSNGDDENDEIPTHPLVYEFKSQFRGKMALNNFKRECNKILEDNATNPKIHDIVVSYLLKILKKPENSETVSQIDEFLEHYSRIEHIGQIGAITNSIYMKVREAKAMGGGAMAEALKANEEKVFKAKALMWINRMWECVKISEKYAADSAWFSKYLEILKKKLKTEDFLFE